MFQIRVLLAACFFLSRLNASEIQRVQIKLDQQEIVRAILLLKINDERF